MGIDAREVGGFASRNINGAYCFPNSGAYLIHFVQVVVTEVDISAEGVTGNGEGVRQGARYWVVGGDCVGSGIDKPVPTRAGHHSFTDVL